jgi:hypothetical protein
MPLTNLLMSERLAEYPTLALEKRHCFTSVLQVILLMLQPLL